VPQWKIAGDLADIAIRNQLFDEIAIAAILIGVSGEYKGWMAHGPMLNICDVLTVRPACLFRDIGFDKGHGFLQSTTVGEFKRPEIVF